MPHPSRVSSHPFSHAPSEHRPALLAPGAVHTGSPLGLRGLASGAAGVAWLHGVAEAEGSDGGEPGAQGFGERVEDELRGDGAAGHTRLHLFRPLRAIGTICISGSERNTNPTERSVMLRCPRFWTTSDAVSSTPGRSCFA